MLITRKSDYSGIERTLDIPVTEEQMQAYQNGGMINRVMPHLTADQREFIMTGIIKEEWDKIFPPEQE